MSNSSIFDFQCQSITGDQVSLDRYRGQVLLVVITASWCGFSPQFRGLEFLYRKYRQDGFSVLGFPTHQLSRQEPYNNEQISDFCVRNYGVSFPMFAKTQVNGPSAPPVFDFLRSGAPGIFGTESIKWNFTKFLLDREGRPVARYGPATFPRRMLTPIEALLD